MSSNGICNNCIKSSFQISQRTRGRNLNLGCSVSNEINLNNLIYEPVEQSPSSSNDSNGLEMGLRRILLMTYFPSGFWSRLITRLLADEHITEAIKSVYTAANDVST